MRDVYNHLHAYPFQRLSLLLEGVARPDKPEIRLTIGEPTLPIPECIRDALTASLGEIGHYPATAGAPWLREACGEWAARRFELGSLLDPAQHVLPVSGTREALFAIAQALIDPGEGGAVMMPNPCYQIYEGAALFAGASPAYLACDAGNGYLPDPEAVSTADWDRCRLLYLCSPGNPTGAVMSLDDLQALIELADRHDFVIASDECYSELYPSDGSPPPGILQACVAAGRNDFKRCLAFHSLSKRSNVPGLRSGFVAGDPLLLHTFLTYRTYQGCAMSGLVQEASAAAWADEDHVQANRRAYDQAYGAFLDAFADSRVTRPAGSFYLWLPVGGDDVAFARRLVAEQNVQVLPGSFLGREQAGPNPGAGYVRLSLVAPPVDCAEAAVRIRACLD